MSEFNRLYGELPASEAAFLAEGMVLVRQQVAKRLRLCPGWRHIQPDLEGEGYVALAELLHTPGVRNPAAWLASCVRRSINRATKHAPHSALPEWKEPADSDDSFAPRESGPKVPGSEGCPAILQAALDSCADAIDRRIIAGRAEGFSDPQLADQLRITSQAVGKRRRAIQEKFDRGAPIDKSAKGGRQGDRRRR